MKTVSLSKSMIYTGNLILVNREHPFRDNEANNNLMPIQNKNPILLNHHTGAIYTKIMDELFAWNRIKAISGWRSLQEQQQIYRDSLAENGTDFTAKYVALPGHSEHQTGLAVDVALNQADIDFITPHFPYVGICNVFRSLASRFGFIERYPQGKENITGIAHEPWHFRYVGAPHSTLMQQLGDTLEEYHTRLKQFAYGREPLRCDFDSKKVEVFYLAASKDVTEFSIGDNAVYAVSGNNVDGFVITIWRDRHWNALDMAV